MNRKSTNARYTATSMNVDRTTYKRFKVEAVRREMEVQQLIQYAMEMVLEEGKKRRKTFELKDANI
jgi:ribonuclease PH